MRVPRYLILLPLAATLIAAAACDGPAPARSVESQPAFWVGCFAGTKFTGGGRVDPEGVGKVTFGFNIHAPDCSGDNIKGDIQVVYHATQTLVHSLTEEHFASYQDPDRGACGEWDGTARVKDVYAGTDWTEHHYTVVVCDKAEPGQGADRISFYLDNAGDGTHNNVIDQVLTGGNIQAHKS